MRRLQSLLAIFIAGLAFFYVDTFLVGYAAALSLPTWYAEFMAKHSGPGFVIWDLMTVVPVTIISAMSIAAALGRVLDRSYFLSGLAAVAVAMVFATFSAPTDQDLIVTFRNHALPVYWAQAPVYLAVWLSLPLATKFFGNRARP